jgi:hypothetical protein
MNMELHILHLYPDLMSLYGEWANLAVLRRHLEALGVTVDLRTATCEDDLDLDAAQLIYVGAGTERAQKAALTALLPYGDRLRAALDRGALALFTGNAMEMLGASITDAAGKTWPALGLADFTTEEIHRRTPEDVVAHTSLLEEPVVGFMNKCSVTHGVTAPLFQRLSLGFGNEAEHGPEGYAAGGVLATHITGPVLVKNPALTDLLLGRIFAAQGWALPAALPDLPHQRAAYQVTLRELQGRI